MRILLTEDAPSGMLMLSAIETIGGGGGGGSGTGGSMAVVTDFYPTRNYQDPLCCIEDYLKMCDSVNYEGAVVACNNSPWSDLVWSRGSEDVVLTRIKERIYRLCGWAPDAIVNIYNKAPCAEWRSKVSKLRSANPDITVVSLDASDPKFNRNIVDAICMLKNELVKVS